MTLRRLVLRSALYHWRTAAAVVMGIAVACGVITGSLVMGETIHGSLRDIAVARLGKVDLALVALGRFRAALVRDLAREPGVTQAVGSMAALLIAPGSARNPRTEAVAAGVTAIGCDAEFWRLQGAVGVQLSGRGCAINGALARDLGLGAGDAVLLRVSSQRGVPTNSLFARRELREAAPALRLQVQVVLPDGGMGDFRLDPQPAVPRNVFIPRELLAQRSGARELANVIVAAHKPGGPAVDALHAALLRACTLQDHGLRIAHGVPGDHPCLQSDAVVLTDTQIAAARAAGRASGVVAQPTSLYLATTIRVVETGKSIAYATIVGMEGGSGPAARGAWLGAWAAADLGARPGDTLAVEYLEPQPDGEYRLRKMTFSLGGVAPAAWLGLQQSLVPTFPGITGAARIGDWDPPFPVDMRRITPRDEEYWSKYRATPKLRLPAWALRRIWRSGPGQQDAGWVTGMRLLPAPGASSSQVDERRFTAALLKVLSPQSSGLLFRPVREQALQAAAGNSDFSQLFLGMSMFLVLSGAGLSAMLLRLSAEQRSAQVGVMLACGLDAPLVRRALAAEGVLLTVVGAAVGTPLGVLYAAGLVRLLGTWWRGALGDTPAPWLHVTAVDLTTGALCGLVVGLVAVWWGTREVAGRSALELLAGWQVAETVGGRRGRPGLWAALAGVCAAVLLCLALAQKVPQQTAFFGIGALLLVALLALTSLALNPGSGPPGTVRSLAALARRNVGASGKRALLVIGLLAAAAFIMVTVASNARDLSRADVSDPSSGAGGFSLVATSSVPLPYDPATPGGRERLGFSPEDEAALQGAQITSLLVSPGEDVSCLNLARPTRPRLVGIPAPMMKRGGFPVTALPEGRGDPWRLLAGEGTPIPAFGDADSVRWTLHLGLGKTYPYPLADGSVVPLRFVGLIRGSIFGRELLIGEHQFRRLFPGVTAPSYFLIQTPRGAEARVAEVLRRNLGELGVEVHTTREVLNGFLRVQNTYLSMFLVLGGLGLLLGTAGLVGVILRSVLERRRELALMLATGFERGRIMALITAEHAGLLVAGLAIGTLCALVAVAPHLLSAEARVNWISLSGVLLMMLGVGLVACLVTVQASVRGDLIMALRQE